MLEDKVRNGNICERLEEGGDDPHPKQSCGLKVLSVVVGRGNVVVGQCRTGARTPQLSLAFLGHSRSHPSI